MFGIGKLEFMGLLVYKIWSSLHEHVFSRFGTIPACDGQIADGRTDTTTAYTAIAYRRAVTGSSSIAKKLRELPKKGHSRL